MGNIARQTWSYLFYKIFTRRTDCFKGAGKRKKDRNVHGGIGKKSQSLSFPSTDLDGTSRSFGEGRGELAIKSLKSDPSRAQKQASVVAKG